MNDEAVDGTIQEAELRRLLLMGFGLILLAAVGGIVCGLLVGPPAAPSSPGTSGLISSGDTARQALAPAADLAVQWQEDAQLAGVSSCLPVEEIKQGGEIEWTFQFFSASTQRLALFTVSGGEAHRVRESLSPYAVPTFSRRAWRVDSDQARQTWLDQGGSRMIARRPDTDLAMKLGISEDGEQHPVWTITGFIAGAESALTVKVDAADGALLEP